MLSAATFSMRAECAECRHVFASAFVEPGEDDRRAGLLSSPLEPDFRLPGPGEL